MKQLLSVSSQLGPLLQAARKSSRLTQAGLAKRLGVSQSRVSAMELDPGSISLDQLLALCGALGLELLVQTKDSKRSPGASTPPGGTRVEW